MVIEKKISRGNLFKKQKIYLDDPLLDKKAERKENLKNITVTTSSGKVFDGRDIDQLRMMSAIQAASILNVTETQWKLNDNTVATVTLDELKEALALSIQAVGNIILS